MRLIDGEVVYSSSDLNDYLACAQRIALGLRALARNEPVASDDPTLELIAHKGQQHERAELARLEAAGVRVVRIDEGDASLRSFRAAVAATRAAMEAGAEAIYQGAFHDGAWAGRADFLIRVDHPSALGAWSYDIADAKLAVSEKASFLVQLCVYADLIAAVQGVLPRSIRALLGDGREVRYDPARYVAYVRLARERFERRIASLDPGDRPGAGERLRRLRVVRALRRAAPQRRPPVVRGRHPARADRAPGRRRPDHAGRAGASARRRQAGAHERADLRRAAQAGRAPARRSG